MEHNEYDWMEEARVIAAQCWCDDRVSDREMDPVFAEVIAEKIAAWIQTAAQNQRNTEYYRDLLEECGGTNMRIYLGNLGIEEIEKRSGVAFSQELKDYMIPRWQQSASNVKSGKWHCFDIPFLLMCGDVSTASEIHKHLKNSGSDFKEPFQIAFSGA